MNEYSRFTLKQKIIIIAAVASVVLIGAICFILLYFRVDHVTVEGNSHYSEEEIKAMVLKDNILDNSILLSAKYQNKEITDIPFIASMDVEVKNHDTVRIRVYEKVLAGCVSYLGNYMYFDRDGTVVESSPQATDGVAEITGLHYDSVELYKKLPVEEDNVFQEILVLTQLLYKYEIMADKIYFDNNMEVTLYYNNARVKLGGSTNIDEKIMQLAVMVPSIQDKKGVLDMSEFSENTTTLTFEPD